MARSNKSSDDESSSSDDEDDDDDDTPLAALGDTKKRSVSRTPVKYNEASDDDEEEEEAEFDDEIMNIEEEQEEEDGGDNDFRSDDDESEEEDDDDSDDDFDDAPLSSLKSAPSKRKRSSSTKATKKTKSKSKTKTKTKTTKTKKTKPKKKKPTKRKSTDQSSSTTTTPTSTAIITPSSELYSKSTKGKIIQSLLCRWWYAITWPNLSTLPPSPPPNCDPLDGFPGVYVHTSGHDVGKIVDYRNDDTCPNYTNMARKGTDELKELLLTAIEKQRVQLVEEEGEGTGVEEDLRVLEKWVRKVNVGKADREASKVLKAAGF